MVRLPSPPPRRSERQKQTERSFGGFDWTEAMLLCAMGGLALWDFDKAYEKHQRKSERKEQRRRERGSCDDGNRGRGRGSGSGSRRGRRTRSVGAGGSSRRDDARSRSERPDRYRDEDGARRRRRERGDNAKYRGSGGGHYGFDARDDRGGDGGRRASEREGSSRVESWVYGDSVGDAGSARGERARRSSHRDDRRGSW